MQLVRTDAHEATFPHRGSVSLFEKQLIAGSLSQWGATRDHASDAERICPGPHQLLQRELERHGPIRTLPRHAPEFDDRRHRLRCTTPVPRPAAEIIAVAAHSMGWRSYRIDASRPPEDGAGHQALLRHRAEQAALGHPRADRSRGHRRSRRRDQGAHGLHTWTDAPRGKIQKFDVVVAKNYLTESELAQLSRLVNAYLDVAEDMALRKIPMTMQDWETRLNRFLAATDREVLRDAGRVTAEIARARRERVREVPHRAGPPLRERLRSRRFRDQALVTARRRAHRARGRNRDPRAGGPRPSAQRSLARRPERAQVLQQRPKTEPPVSAFVIQRRCPLLALFAAGS
jgi:hypothetical protein